MRAILLACALLASVVQLAAQQTGAAHPTAASVLDRMKSPDPAERIKAFDDADQLLASGKSTPDDIDRLDEFLMCSL